MAEIIEYLPFPKAPSATAFQSLDWLVDEKFMRTKLNMSAESVTQRQSNHRSEDAIELLSANFLGRIFHASLQLFWSDHDAVVQFQVEPLLL